MNGKIFADFLNIKGYGLIPSMPNGNPLIKWQKSRAGRIVTASNRISADID
ncbi:MAG: hypothetical protein ACR2PY_06980 [Salinispira sp.]